MVGDFSKSRNEYEDISKDGKKNDIGAGGDVEDGVVVLDPCVVSKSRLA